MPRDLPISNGNLMINFDHDYNIRDVYYPHVGQDNQTAGDISYFGVRCDGKFAWISSPMWQKTLEYDDDTLVTRVRAIASEMDLEMTIRDGVDFDRDVFLRSVELRNRKNTVRRVRVYTHFDSHLWGSAIVDTIFFDPEFNGLVAYEAQRYVLMNGAVDDQFGFQSFAIGSKEREGFQGTWRDAEDGNLQRNPIAQGSVDATGMLELRLPASGASTAWIWWTFGKDTSTYMWPRDGAIVTASLVQAGYPEITRGFFQLCCKLVTSEGFLLHKYNPDGSVGSSWHPWMSSDGKRQLPIQEDETALVLWALWMHFEKFHDVEFVKPLYKPLVKGPADSTIDVSLAGLWLFGMFDADDPRIISTMEQVIDRLTVKTPIGGVARYQNDSYFQVSKDLENVAGNPWILSTMSIAHWYASRARNLVELQRAIDILLWATTHAMTSGVLPEQIDPYTGAPLSVAPLSWSHASFVLAANRVADRLNSMLRTEAQAEIAV